MKAKILFLLVAIALLGAAATLADDVSGTNHLLCATLETYECDREAEGGCTAKPPAAVNVPLFLEIELDKKLLHTTSSADESRATPVREVTRADGRLTLQGVEQGNAFSLVIDEVTGLGTLSVTIPGEVVVIHGACTAKD
jgi:hypothetical protein